MKTLNQMIDERKALIDEAESLIKEGKEGVRQLSDDEQKTYDEKIEAVEKLDKEISRVRSLEKLQGVKHVSAPGILKVSKEPFSLMRTIRNMAAGKRMHDADAEIIKQGEDDCRRAGISPQGEIVIPLIDHNHEKRADILAGTATQGAEVVATDVLNLVGPLRAALVFSRFGATYLTGLVGDVDIPKYAGSTAAWKGEVASAADAAGAFSEVSLSPLRITGYMDVSKRFLIQDAANSEQLLRSDLVAAVSGLLESTALSKAAASAGVSPAGLLPDDSDEFSGTAITWADIISLETAVDTANALEGNLGYITSPGLKGYMKSNAKISSTDSKMLLEGTDLNGYPIAATSNMATDLHTDGDEHGLVFANWRHFIIGQWGGVDLVVDPYSLATTAQVRITVNSYWDYALRHSDALAFGTAPLA